MYEDVGDCAFGTHLERYGGHTQAAGFTIKSELIKQLHTHLLDYNNISHKLTTASNEDNELNNPTGLVIEQESPLVASPKMVDLVFTKIERLNESTYKLLQQLGPFGANNPEPIFKMEQLRLLDRWISGYNRQNLRLRLGTNQGQITGIYTRGARISELLATTTHVNVIFQLAMNESNNHPDVWLKVLDLEAART
jgi:single-stranded-DNA-specific exonuclease